jgi:hypothetical protein
LGAADRRDRDRREEILDNKIRIDGRELQPSIRQVLAQVADAWALGEQLEGFLQRVVDLEGGIDAVLPASQPISCFVPADEKVEWLTVSRTESSAVERAVR